MAKRKKDTSAEKALKDFIRQSGLSLSEARLILQEARNSAESRAIEADVDEDMAKGGMAKKRYRPGGLVTKKKYVNPVTVVDNRKNK